MVKASKVVIVGVGHIGGSLGGALMNQKSDPWHIVGIDENSEHRQIAMKRKLVHEIHPVADFGEHAHDVDIVVVCVHLNVLPNVVLSCSESLVAFQKSKRRYQIPVITDVGSVKTPLLTEFGGGIAANIPFVGGHPIAGTEKSGPQFADPELFKGKLVILTPVKKTDPKAVLRVRSLWESIGAEVEEMTPQEHDQAMAASSHLPHMIAYGLMEAVYRLGKPTNKRKARNLMRYAGGGLKDFTRIAETQAEMWKDIAMENQAPILETILEFKKVLSNIEEYIARGDGPSLSEILQRAQEIRKTL
jgi:prephenate dehydrogenase